MANGPMHSTCYALCTPPQKRDIELRPRRACQPRRSQLYPHVWSALLVCSALQCLTCLLCTYHRTKRQEASCGIMWAPAAAAERQRTAFHPRQPGMPYRDDEDFLLVILLFEMSFLRSFSPLVQTHAETELHWATMWCLSEK